MKISYDLNGTSFSWDIESSLLLVDLIRVTHRLVGRKRSCDVQVCGACTVHVNDLPVSSCCTLAVHFDGQRLTTIEGFASQPEFERFQSAFASHAEVQFGFCTPGILLTLNAMRDADSDLTASDIRRGLSGNPCRGTGYVSIVAASADALGVKA